MQFLNQANLSRLKGTALLRLDMNTDDEWRLKASLPTLKFLLRHSSKLVIFAHKGRPKARVIRGKPAGFEPKMSLKRECGELQILLRKKVKFLPDFRFPEIRNAVKAAQPGTVFLLENLRFVPGEEANDKRFAKQLAGLGNFFVNDAFAVSHRANASVSAITAFLPSYAGLQMEKEIDALSGIMEEPKKPLVVVLGGGKASDKLGVLKYFENIADSFLLGGVAANTLLLAKGEDVGSSKVDSPDNLKDLQRILKQDNVILPSDWKAQNGTILDIGKETVSRFEKEIRTAKTIIWNGPMGLIEDREFEKGTFYIAKAIAKNVRAFKLAGGGETVMFLKKHKLDKKFSFISTGGGAMLDFLAGKTLPGIEALNKYD